MTTALTRGPRPRHLADDHQCDHAYPLSAVVVDPCRLPPLCGEPEFAALLAGMVADAAPRLFAVVQEYGERVDGRIAGWGMAFQDHAEVVSAEGTRRMRVQAAEKVLRLFTLGSHIRARLVWLKPDSATSGEDADQAA